MATLRISIEMDNAAFGNNDGEHTNDSRVAEVIWSLTDYVDRLWPTAELERPLRDSNGNTVGKARVEP